LQCLKELDQGFGVQLDNLQTTLHIAQQT
jgi:hypothetical protein